MSEYHELRPRPAVRLRDLEPRAVADQVLTRIREHVASIIMRTDLGATWTWPESGHESLRWTVQLLVGYAQRGVEATDWPDDASARDAILDVVSALYTRAGDDQIGAGVLDRIDDLADDPSDPIDVVLLAAWCRCQLAAGEQVTIAELAALTSRAVSSVHSAAQRGQLRIRSESRGRGVARRVSAVDARAWLASIDQPSGRDSTH